MNTPNHALSGQRGVTLLELMITVAIVAIITSVALPSYQNSVRKGRRSDASDAAAAVLQAQERWRASNATYTTNFANLNTSSTTANGYYTVALTVVDAAAARTAYTVSFTPVAAKGQNRDTDCVAMSVLVNNGSPTYSPAACWSR